MSQNLTQPEEIDQILQNMGWGDVGRPPTNFLKAADRKGRRVGVGDISPYRAVYMKSHDFSDQ